MDLIHQSTFQWADLAGAHYSNVMNEWMTENVDFGNREINSPNVLQTRPIESFWGELGQKFYDNERQTKTHEKLIARIKLKLKN